MAKEKIHRLILGDQLNSRHSWFQEKDDDCTYVMMEMRQETDYVKHHIQKVTAFFAAMRSFAAWLKQSGHHVIYIQLDDPENRQTLKGNLEGLIQKHRFTRFEYQLPDEYRLDVQLKAMANDLPVDAASADTEHFLTDRHELKDLFKGKKQFLMESFYRHMRKKHNLLMKDRKPVGGRWNFDQSNREPYDGTVPFPAPKQFKNRIKDIRSMIENTGVKTFCNLTSQTLSWPINRKQALSMLNEFIRQRLLYFGTYQDAMVGDSWSLFHSLLSFSLNTKMLNPMEPIQAAIKAWQKGENRIELQHVEGFIRQILGWREYMRGIYWAFMPGYADKNYFNHKNILPHYYWDRETRMTCMEKAIGQSLDHAYAHHIQRLMITGNFTLLAGVHPNEVDQWYLGVYIDAIQWVEITNTRGMSQFADGGIIATKPYIASANYINKMSDYCRGCYYDHKKRHGPGSCPFNSLYWDFLARHRALLEKNPRIGMMYRTWDRKQAEEKQAILKQASTYKQQLESL